MLILVSNDDGIEAAGICALAEALDAVGEVWVVAPDRERSAASHSLSLRRPIAVEERGPRRFAVEGTPTDCVKLAVGALLPDRPALVVSGINHGPNLGDDVTYSGTVAAAREGVLLGLPAVAVSQLGRGEHDFAAAAAFAARLVPAVAQAGLAPNTMLNVNVPALAAARIRGHAVTCLGRRRYVDEVLTHGELGGKRYYAIDGDEPGFVPQEGSDFAAIEQGFISVTPLHLDATHFPSIPEVSDWAIPWP